MTTNFQNQNSEYDLLCNELPANIAQAVELCALPHALTDTLGYEIIHGFAKFNGTARAVWAELKQLPFVYPYEDDQYRFEQPARTHFISRLEQRNGTFLELNHYLQEYFSAERKQITTSDAPQARELDWRIAYHLAPVAPAESVERLKELGEKAARSNRMSDVKSVIDVFEEQTRWLSNYGVERAYFEGRYAYARRDFKAAESKFDLVWNQGQDDMLKAISGHLLGIIRAKKSDQQWLRNSEKVLRGSLDLGIHLGEEHHQAMVLTSLGDVLVDLGGRERLVEAEQCYRRGLEIQQRLGDQHGQAMVLNSLGGVLVKLGGNKNLEEAEQYYRRSLEIDHNSGNQHGEAMALNSLGGVLVKLGGNNRLVEAEQCYRRSLEIGEKLGLDHHIAMVLNSLGGVLVKLGGNNRLVEAEQCYRRSLEIGEKLGLDHHIAMVLNSLGGVLVKLGGNKNLEEAEQYYRRSLEILEKLGDKRGQSMVLFGLSNTAETQGNNPMACEYLERVIAIDESLGNTRFISQNRQRLRKLQSGK